jgi:5'-methylthioadenosine phosphorylase
VSGARVGLLGGSGLYALEQLEDPRQERTITPFGEPSDAIVTGRLAGVPVAFLARHGRGHRLSPTEINYRANICALKMLGCDAILSASAVGSLREQIRPTDLVIPDQFIDRTRHREDTFFGGGIVGHVSLADPVCPALAGVLSESGLAAGANVHRGGTYVCMEGPQFSTRAESQLYRDWGGSVIGMTNLTEARLAREAEICYATLALVTDYDCWREATDAVTVEQVLNILAANAAMAQRVLLDAVGRISADRSCGCRSALRYAVITAADAISSDARERLRPIVGKYLS